MKKLLVLSLFALFAVGCGNSSSQTSAVNNQQTNVNVAIKTDDNSLTVSSHSQNQTETATVPTKPDSNGGSPMARSVDVSKMTETIDKAKDAFDKNPKSDEAKKALAKAYFDRAFALTDAAQYRAALGDFRKGLKLDPTDEDAKKMHDQIISIFQSIGREPPKEGEEPPPMPIKSSETSSNQSDSSNRITFKSGAKSAIASGNLKNYDDSKEFVIEVKKGQTLKTEQVKDENSLAYITVDIKSPSGEIVGDSDASCNNRKEIQPTVAGDYKIKVFECKKADPWNGKFDLKVSVN